MPQQPFTEGTLAQPPYSQLVQPVVVRIGGAPTTVTYAGVAPGLIVGAIQINAVVPPGSATGPAVPVELSVGAAAASSGVTVAVQ